MASAPILPSVPGNATGDSALTARNVWLRSVGVRLEYEYVPNKAMPNMHLIPGDLETLTRQLRPSGAAVALRETFDSMNENGIAGMELQPGAVIVHRTDGRIDTFRHTRGVLEDGTNIFDSEA